MGVHAQGQERTAADADQTRPRRANRWTTNGRSRNEKLRRKLAVPSQGRMYYIRYALKMGWTDRPDS